MELTASFVDLLQHFAPVFTTPTFQTFLQIVTGWILSHRHRYVTEVIFAGGNVGNGHWCRFHRFFSHAAWDMDTLALFLAKLVGTILAPGATLFWAVDDTLCRKRGLTLYGAGMHYDPLISSRAKSLVSWGHDWVVLCLIIVKPFWAPTKVFALPIAVRLYRNRQGLTKGKKSRGKAAKPNPDHRTRPATGPRTHRAWWLNGTPTTRSSSRATAPTGARASSLICRPMFTSSAMFIPRVRFTNAPPSKRRGAREHLERKETVCRAWPSGPTDPAQPWTRLKFNQFGLHATLAVKTMKALYYKAGGDRELTIVLVRDLEGKRPDQMFYCTKLDWNARQILTAYSYRWAIECTFENCKQLLGLEDPANRLPKAVERTAPFALFLYSLVVVWFHKTGHQFVRFPDRPWYRAEARTFVC